MDNIKGLTFSLVILSIILISGCSQLTEPLQLNTQSPRLSGEPSYPYFGPMTVTPTTLNQGGSVFFRINALSFNNYPLSVQLYVCRNQYTICTTSYSMVKEVGNYFNYTYANALSGDYYVYYDVVETGGGSALGMGPVFFRVNGLPDPTISNVNAAPSPISRGNLITFSSTINTNGNTIDSTQVIVDNTQSFNMAGTNPALVSVNSSQFTTGSHSYKIVVNYLGNTAQKTSTGYSFTVNEPPQPIAVSNILPIPNPVTSGASVEFDADVTSNIGSTITKAEIIFANGAKFTMTKSTGNKYIFSINSNNFPSGINTFTIKAYDASGNTYTTPNNQFTINPSDGPTIGTIIVNPTAINVGDNFDVTATITLGSATSLNFAKVYIGPKEYSLTRLGSTNNYKATIPSSELGSGTFTYSVAAFDNLENEAFSSAQSLTITSSGTPSGTCGNGVINSGEECDSSNLNSQTCVSQGFDSGTLSCTSSCTFNIANCIDTTAPEISSISVSKSGTSATIEWETNELADSKVEYGKKSHDYDKDKSKSDFVFNHSLTITGLTKDTKYYYTITSIDRKGNAQNSSEKSFTTDSEDDSTIPGVSSKQVSNINSNGATIYVSPTEASIVKIRYGTSSGSYSFSKESSDYVTSYNVHLDNLQADTTYYYVIELEDASGNTFKSSEYSFSTLVSSSTNTNTNNNNNNNNDYANDYSSPTSNNYTMYIIAGVLLVLIIAAVFFMKNKKPKKSTFKPLITQEDKKPIVQPQVIQRPIQQQPMVREQQDFRTQEEIKDEERVLDGLRKITGQKK